MDEFARFEEIGPEALAWTRPNFFALRYELVCASGVLARISVHGIGGDRHVLAETAAQSWRFGVFPLERRLVPIWPSRSASPAVAHYERKRPVEIRFEDGPVFQFRNASPVKTMLETQDSCPVFQLEQSEAFPRWRCDVTLEPGALTLPQLPVLLSAACCFLVFDGARDRQSGLTPALQQAPV